MIKMPWNNVTCPNVMIEITDACNLDCRVCYKKKGTSFKSISSIKHDLETAIKLRKLHTVTISGGEPTLHPELYQIVKMIKLYGFHVFLLTNGVLIDEVCIQKLKEAGLDSILFHVDLGQDRPDLPTTPNFNKIKLRLDKLTQLASSRGLDISISLTLYDNDRQLSDYSKFFFESERITFLFISRGIDPKSLFSRFSEPGEENKAAIVDNTGARGIKNIIEFYHNNYGIEPFSYIPGLNGKDTVWMSYFVPIIYSKHGNKLFKIKSNFVDSWLMEIPRIISGRYIHKTKQNVMITLLRTFFNSAATFRPFYFFRFLFSLKSAGARLKHKMIVYDNGPIIDDKGQLVYCEYCPTAIVRNDKLLTCCTADYGLSEKSEKNEKQSGIIEQTKAFCNICESNHEAEIIRRDNCVIAIVYCPKGQYEYEISSNADMFLEFRKRSFTDISGEIVQNSRYILNYIPITTACNFNCTICGANAKGTGSGAIFLSVDEICQRVEQVKKNGGYLINLTGGEPTLHPDLLKIVKRVSGMGINIGLNTNGYLLGKDQDLAEGLKRNGLKRVVIQFDSFNEKTLIQLGRNYLSEKKSAINNAMRAGLKIGLNCTTTRHNLLELSDLLTHGLDLGSSIINLAFASPAPMGRYLLSDNNSVDREEMVAELLKAKEKYHFSFDDFLPLPTYLPLGIQLHPDCGVHVIFLRAPFGIKPLNYYIDIKKLYYLLSRIHKEPHWFFKSVIPFLCLLKSIRRGKIYKCLSVAFGLLFFKRDYSLVNVGLSSYKSALFLDENRVKRCAAAFYSSAGPVNGCWYAFRTRNFPGSHEYEEAHRSC